MIPEAFSKLAQLVPDGLLLLSGEGRVLAANRTAQAWLGQWENESPCTQTIHDVCSDAPDAVADFLSRCRRSGSELLGSLKFHDNDTPRRVFGRCFTRGKQPSDSTVLLRVPREDAPINQFTILNLKIEELGREITRRTLLERELREQHELAAFGRDIGLVLAESAPLQVILQRCAELLVRNLHAAFARIWTLAPGSDELRLQASAGIYTHLNGPHSRIRVGDFKIGLIAQEGKAHLTNRVIGDERVHDQEWARREGLVGFAGYPLLVQQQTVGVMAVFARQEISQSGLDAMASVANSIALGVERKQIEATLEQQTLSLKQADKRKDEFLAMLAHELRNPLAPIRSGLELLQLDSGGSETLTLMYDQVQHLTRLVDDLLDVSRIMRGRIELRRSPVRMDNIIDHAVATAQPAIDHHRHTLTVDHGQQPVWVHADRVRLGQIITNLLTNAAKYTPKGGQILVQSQIEAERVVLTVRDNGVGIEAGFLPDVFELFAQSERGLSRSEGGLGIGLTLVKRLVELHGGTVHVASGGSNQGSEFTVSLPLAAEPQPIAEASPTPLRELPPNLRILVVDDSLGSAKILRRLLQAIGASTIETAYDGPSAITTAEAFAPDVIFLDIGLPGLSGFEVAQRLRSNPGFQATKLVALTGYGTAEDRRKSREAGFNDHLVKPVSLDELKQVLSR